MIKNKFYILLGLLLLLSYGCSNKGLSQKITDCYYPDAPKEKAPLWICGAKLDGLAVSAVGSVDKSVAGINFMKQQATANARAVLAQEVKADLQAQVSNYTAVNGAGDKQNVEQNASVIINQITNQSLQGTRVYKEDTSPNGTLYVIVGFDSDMYKKFIQDIINKNDKTLNEPDVKQLKEVLTK